MGAACCAARCCVLRVIVRMRMRVRVRVCRAHERLARECRAHAQCAAGSRAAWARWRVWTPSMVRALCSAIRALRHAAQARHRLAVNQYHDLYGSTGATALLAMVTLIPVLAPAWSTGPMFARDIVEAGSGRHLSRATGQLFGVEVRIQQKMRNHARRTVGIRTTLPPLVSDHPSLISTLPPLRG